MAALIHKYCCDSVRVDCLGNFTQNLDFIIALSGCRYCSFLNVLAAFVPFLSCTLPKNFGQMLIVDYSAIACGYNDDVILQIAHDTAGP